ncbi:hypothetical protein ED208_05095 [Stagnimonas aquatica]|uniref:Uncharacterized protein n=2 Tax=Stagnimonas aquatica TaxID=2689987 RepID=A0A3N0VGE7_9GAMM|nr:hypothetical protein ED208_05095 [Stagnimonas aquatica]
MEMLAAPQELWPSESMKEGLSELLQAVIRLRLVEKRALNFAEVARCRTQEPDPSPAGYVSARKWLKTMGNPSKDKLEDLCDWMVEAAKTPRPSIRRVVYRTPQLEWFEESLKPLHGQYKKWRLGPLARPRDVVRAEVLEQVAALKKTCPS